MSSIVHQRLEAVRTWATPARLQLFLAAYFAANLLPFLYAQAGPGILDRQDRVRGRDFLSLYIAGRVANEGPIERCYDQDYFLKVQESLATVTPERPRHFSLYPPPMLLLFGLIARLPYDVALLLWWLLQAGAITAACWMLLEDMQPFPAWRLTVVLAFLAFAPVLDVFVNGQMSGFWLLILTGGLRLRRRGQMFGAGMLLALLALKPTLALGLVLWIVVRGQVRLGLGFILGCLVIAGVTAAMLGPEVFNAFRLSTQNGEVWSLVSWAPYHIHTVLGILHNFVGGYPLWIRVVHFLVAAVAGAALVRIAWVQRESPRTSADQDAARRIDEASLVLFIVLATPYILTYDLCLLLIPICHLWSIRRDEDALAPVAMGTLLYLSGMALPLYTLIRFSLVPAAALAAMICISRSTERRTSKATAPPTVATILPAEVLS
jgi:Glycosyltransferase family 87